MQHQDGTAQVPYPTMMDYDPVWARRMPKRHITEKVVVAKNNLGCL